MLRSRLMTRTAVAVSASFVVLTGCENGDDQTSLSPSVGESALAQARAIDRQLNTFTTSTQERVAIDAYAAGRMLAVWDSRRQQQGRYGVYGRILDASGTPMSDELTINQTVEGHQLDPAVAIGPDGNAWVTWMSFGQDADAGTIIARRINIATGDVGDEVIVNATTRGHQGDPAVAVNADGDAMVVWTSEAAHGTQTVARIIRDDAPVGNEILLDGSSETKASLPTVTALANGSFAVAWQRSALDGTPLGLVGQRLDATGAEVGERIAVNDKDDAYHFEASLDGDSSGGFAVAWMRQNGDDLAVMARRFDARGNATTPAQVIAQPGTDEGWVSGAAIALAQDGRAVISCNQVDMDGDAQGVIAQHFDASLRAIGEPFVVTQTTAGMQSLQSASNARRVVWTDRDQIAYAWWGDAGQGDDSAANVTIHAHAELPQMDAAPLRLALAGSGQDSTAAPIPPIYDPDFKPLPPLGPLAGGDGPDFGFNAIDFTGWTPPDPEIAVGPDHLVGVTNGAIAFFDKAGNLLFQDEIEDSFGFWGEQGATGFVFDPEALYDPHSERFFAMACERSNTNRSYFLLAVSDDSNPVGTWHKYRIDVTNVENNIDSPNMAVDADVVYLSADFFGPDRYQVLMIEKGPILSGGAINSDEFVFSGSGNQSMGIPVAYDTSSNGVGFVIQSSEGTGNGLDFDEIRFHAIENQLSNPTVTSVDVNVPTYSYPNQPPQMGTSNKPFLFEPRFWSCAFRNGSFWAVHHVNSQRVRARWYEFEMNGWPDSGDDPTLRQSGELDYDNGIHTFFPSIAVDDQGNAAITFARSSSQEFISMSRAIRRHDDPLGEFRDPEFVKKSTSPYTGSNRWGDYSGTKPEPGIPGVFWGHHEWTDASSTWRTWMAQFDTNESAIDLVDFNVQFGSLIDGGVGDLAASDDSYLQTRSRANFTANEPNLLRLDVDFEASGGAPATIAVTIESRVNNPNGTATIRIQNQSTNQFETIGTYALPQTDQTEVISDIDAGNYFDGNAMTMRIKHVVPATLTAAGFDSFFDLISVQAD